MTKGKKILIVDDEPDIANVFRAGLELSGYHVKTFNDPEEALTHFEPQYYDLLLLDIKMPKMNGFELYKALVKKDPKVRACFMTAYEVYYDEFKKLFPTYETHCFIRKPVSIRALAAIVTEQLKPSSS